MADRGLGKRMRRLAVGTIACAGGGFIFLPALADTLDGALVLAYQNNPTLNAQRASARATDEGVPQALSGYRPRVSVNGSIGTQYWDTTSKPSVNLPVYIHQSGNMTPNNYGITATQTLYNGFQTSNRTRQAESQVQAAREQLRVSEQSVLLSAVTAYMNLLRDAAILDLQRRNVQCRRGDTHRRSAIGIAPCGGPLAGVERGGNLQGIGCDLPAGDRG
jgi:outer membrane protein